MRTLCLQACTLYRIMKIPDLQSVDRGVKKKPSLLGFRIKVRGLDRPSGERKRKGH